MQFASWSYWMQAIHTRHQKLGQNNFLSNTVGGGRFHSLR